ncbi:hypothetical protein GOP47_0020388 [Adiantum capillus-veneris]|uniref:Pentatricopeptide repeat-containing protein n=1 Tax=Adiantum capillus-veneris TaxID=13818 RepID=A0A9D4Z803_ADICA|nr:hypothetical protein GOP47_0020388 [Adiantum capillus-veneris]
MPSLLHDGLQPSLERGPFPHRQPQNSCFKTRARASFALRRKSEDEDFAGLWVCNATKAANVKVIPHVKTQDNEEEEEEEENAESISSKDSRLSVWKDAHELHALMASLKTCIKHRDLQNGSRIHANIASTGILQNDIFVANSVINLYAKCGALDKACEVCDKLKFRNVVSWNILIAGYADYGPGEKALRCFECMQREGLSPNSATFICMLKACASIRAAEQIHELHVQIERGGFLEKDLIVGTTLVDTYAKLGLLKKAHEVFNKLPICDAILWNVLITGHAQHGQGEDALNCLRQMRHQGFSPNDVTFIGSLKACATLGKTHMGQELHAEVVKLGLDAIENVVANAIIDMYTKFGLLAEAQSVLETLSSPDVVSFGGLIAGYAQHGHGEEAMLCFNRMHSERISPNGLIFVSILKACGYMEAFHEGFQIHSQIVKEGVHEKDVIVNRSLLDMYGKCGFLEEAQSVLDKLPHWDVHSFNVLISEYVENGCDEQALHCFDKMQVEGLWPNSITLAYILKACGNMGAADKGQQIHEQIIMYHGLEKDLAVGTTLVDMYANCGLLAKAQEVFDALPIHDVISWNALIGGYTQDGRSEQAMHCFEQMKVEGLSPDVITFICALKACAIAEAVNEGLLVHAEIEKMGFLEGHAGVSTTLVDMYAKFGLFVEAEHVLNRFPNKDIIAWNALITEYAKKLHDAEALICFERLQRAGLSGNAFTFSSALKSCASIGATYIGQDMHAKAVRLGLIKEEIIVTNALIDMYSNFGMLMEAQQLFDRQVVRDVVSWNALLGGYSQLGKVETVFEIYEKMVAEDIYPDIVTFAIMLNTCSHYGLLEKGQILFEAINTRHNMQPSLEHHTCMVDLFGRAGHWEKAVSLIKDMPFFANSTLWLVVLGACQKWGETKLGGLAFQYAAKLGRKDAAAYISLGNLY